MFSRVAPFQPGHAAARHSWCLTGGEERAAAAARFWRRGILCMRLLRLHTGTVTPTTKAFRLLFAGLSSDPEDLAFQTLLARLRR